MIWSNRCWQTLELLTTLIAPADLQMKLHLWLLTCLSTFMIFLEHNLSQFLSAHSKRWAFKNVSYLFTTANNYTSQNGPAQKPIMKRPAWEMCSLLKLESQISELEPCHSPHAGAGNKKPSFERACKIRQITIRAEKLIALVLY